MDRIDEWYKMKTACLVALPADTSVPAENVWLVGNRDE